jgi:hypothetical protein
MADHCKPVLLGILTALMMLPIYLVVGKFSPLNLTIFALALIEATAIILGGVVAARFTIQIDLKHKILSGSLAGAISSPLIRILSLTVLGGWSFLISNSYFFTVLITVGIVLGLGLGALGGFLQSSK